MSERSQAKYRYRNDKKNMIMSVIVSMKTWNKYYYNNKFLIHLTSKSLLCKLMFCHVYKTYSENSISQRIRRHNIQ